MENDLGNKDSPGELPIDHAEDIPNQSRPVGPLQNMVPDETTQ
jgi:hypothetical protein